MSTQDTGQVFIMIIFKTSPIEKYVLKSFFEELFLN